MKVHLLVMLAFALFATGCAGGDPRRQPDYRGFAVRSDAKLGPVKQWSAYGVTAQARPAMREDAIAGLIGLDQAARTEAAANGLIWLLGQQTENIVLNISLEDMSACATLRRARLSCTNGAGGLSIVELGLLHPQG